ncbi:MAG: hypothetical protein AAFS02_11910 [Pseudomonadota bacterium]
MALTTLLLLLPAVAQSAHHAGESKTTDSALRNYAGLGAISFPNSGAPEAQDAFYQGVLLMHSFEFTPAAEAFREAQAIDADFALAYWGEAMTYNHPLWRQHDAERGAGTLARLAATPAARRAKAGSEREGMYLDAIEILYGFEGTKAERDRAYMEAMAELVAAYPDDDEARTFYALSILGSVDGSRDFATYMRAAAQALPVFERNPRHPGAAHYIIHAFDDPIHAPLGLPAALAYADIAPDAAHAQHMTSHIFLASGMWEQTVAANERAHAVQNADYAARGRPANVCGHYSSWLHYGHLQLGQVQQAEALMDRCHERVQGDATLGEWAYFVSMRARQILDTDNAGWVERWQVSAEQIPGGGSDWGYGSPAFKHRVAEAMAGLQLGNTGRARELLERRGPEATGAALQLDQVAGMLALHDGDIERGLSLLRQAAETEAELPLEFGPPGTVMPSHEVLGAALLAQGRFPEAADAYRSALARTPGRLPALRGLAAANAALVN